MMDEEKLKPEEEEPKAAEEEPTPTEETTPTEESTPAEEPESTEEPKPTEEPEPTEEPKPAEEPTPTEKPAPAEEPKPVIEPKPVAEPKPMPTVGKPKTAGIAIAGFICGLVALIFFWGTFIGFFRSVLAILGIVFGAVGRARIRASQGQLTGSGFATAGLICGIVALVGAIIRAMILGIGVLSLCSLLR